MAALQCPEGSRSDLRQYPPALSGRGEFIPNGKYISLFFRGTGGATVERLFEASTDHSELTESSNPPATYRRGAPP